MDLINKFPNKPGVYMFKDSKGGILYVGKAINLKSRVGSYFTDKHQDRPWIAVMMGLVKDVETIVVENELEALLLESTLIKEHLPKFNIKLTDDKSYPFIRLSKKEKFARFSVTRRHSAKDHATYFGPYLSGRYAHFTLEFLRNLYGIHISNKPLKTLDRPCFYCQLSGQNCVLAGEKSIESYDDNINSATEFLRGRRKSLINDLRSRMNEAANQQHFEVAAKLRDRLEAIEHTTIKQQVVSTDFDDFDAIGVYQTTNRAALVLQSIREGRLTDQKDFYFQNDAPTNPSEIVRQFLISYYRTMANIPKLVALPMEIEDKEAIVAMLVETSGQAIDLHVPQRGDKKQMVELAARNAQAKLELKLLKKGDAITKVIALQELLTLPFLPERIEAIDISNLGTSEAVGACICFINGEPAKDDYRRYIIKTVEGQNDFAMIREVVSRRLHDTSRPAPDLLVIDGGKEQLKFALEGMDGAPMQPKVIISLAKKPDRIFVPGRKLPVATPRGNQGIRLLARIRDEVHRFGINFQRFRQRKKSLKVD